MDNADLVKCTLVMHSNAACAFLTTTAIACPNRTDGQQKPAVSGARPSHSFIAKYVLEVDTEECS